MVRFVLADVFTFGPTAGPFDFVYDGGLYHIIRQTDLRRYLDLLWRVTKPGSYYLCLAGSDGEEADGGPPQVSESQIRGELGRLFEFVHLRPTRLEGSSPDRLYPAWSCLMRR